MGALSGIKLVIYAAVFAAGIGSASFVLLPRIDVQRLNYEKEVITSKGLQYSIDDQNAKVAQLGEESQRMIESSKNSLEKTKKDNVVREYKITSLMSSKAPTLDLCKDASQMIDKEFMK